MLFIKQKYYFLQLTVFCPVEYPESGLEAIAIAGKDKIESTYPNISVIVTMVDSNDKNLVLDAEVTKPLFRHVNVI